MTLLQTPKGVYNRRPVPAVDPADPMGSLEIFRDWLNTELLNVQFAVRPTAPRTITASTTLTATDGVVLVDATTAAVTATLPQPNRALGLVYTVKKIDSTTNAVTLGGVVDGATNPAKTVQYTGWQVACDGKAWYIVATF